MNRLEEIRQRLDAATPGPWRRAEPEGCTTDHGWQHHPCKDVVAGEEDVVSSIGHDADAVVADDADINLIAHAPQDIALLLEIAEAAQSVVRHALSHGEECVYDGVPSDEAGMFVCDGDCDVAVATWHALHELLDTSAVEVTA